MLREDPRRAEQVVLGMEMVLDAGFYKMDRLNRLKGFLSLRPSELSLLRSKHASTPG